MKSFLSFCLIVVVLTLGVIDVKAANVTGVYGISTPQGNWSSVYSSFPNGLRKFTFSKPGQDTSQYQVSSTGPYMDVKKNGALILVLTSPSPGEVLITTPSCSFTVAEATADPSLYTQAGIQAARAILLRDKSLIIALASAVDDANLIWGGYVVATNEQQSRAVNNQIQMAGYIVISIPGGGTPPTTNDTTVGGCVWNCRINFWGCEGEKMCVIGCEAWYGEKALDWRDKCGYSHETPPGVLSGGQ